MTGKSALNVSLFNESRRWCMQGKETDVEEQIAKQILRGSRQTKAYSYDNSETIFSKSLKIERIKGGINSFTLEKTDG